MDETKIRDRVEEALKILLKNDAYLLEHDVNERSITHKLAEYLQQELRKYSEFNDYQVDCEYNKDLKKCKLGKQYKIKKDTLKILKKNEINTEYLEELKEKEFEEDELRIKLSNKYGFNKEHIDTILKNMAIQVYPDIIVHKRDKEDNLLVIEATKSTHSYSKKRKDKKKLQGYKDMQGYKYISYIEFYVGYKYNDNKEKPYNLDFSSVR